MAEESPVNYDEYFKSWSYTQSEVARLKHIWTINNYSCYNKKNGESFVSPTFSAEINGVKSEWYMELYPKGYNEKNKNYVNLGLRRTGNLIDRVVKGKISFVNDRGNNILGENFSRRFKTGNKSVLLKSIGQEFLLNEKNGILLDDKITIAVEIITMVSNRNISGKLTKPQSHLIDLTYLFKNTDFSDVTLSANEKEFPAHKAILAAQSPVFRAMFQQGVNESDESMSNRVEITDVDEESLCEMLRYMYTGKINKFDEMAPRLLSIADKYAIDDLKITCENVLAKNLSLDNVTEMFILSDKSCAKDLKIIVKEFIVAHAAVVKDMSEFKAMVKNYPHLGMEAFCALNGVINPF